MKKLLTDFAIFGKNIMGNNNCNLTTYRYNQCNKCTNEDKWKECVEVSKRVLCLEGNECFLKENLQQNR